MTISARLRRFLLLTSIFVVPSLVPSLVSAQAAPAAPNQPAESPAASDEPEKEVEVVVVRGRFIPEPQRVTSEVANFLSAADLARRVEVSGLRQGGASPENGPD